MAHHDLRTWIYCIAAIFIFAVFNANHSQIPGGMNETTATRLGGNNFLVGTVFSPLGRPINVRIGVRLTTPMTGDVVATTDDRGQFLFSGLSAGEYSVVVDGDRNYEPVSQRVEVVQSRSPSPQTYTISIRLIAKGSGVGKTAVVDQSSLIIPKRASEYYRNALDLSTKGDHKGAVEKLKLAIAEYPSYESALNELGVQYLKMNELDKAVEVLQSALKLNPNSYEPMVNHGIALFRLNQYAPAEAALRSVLKIKDQSSVAHYYLGRVFLKVDRFKEAEVELKLALEIGGKAMPEAHRMLATLYMARNDDKLVINELKTYLKLVPDAPDAERIRQVLEQLKNSSAKSKH